MSNRINHRHMPHESGVYRIVHLLTGDSYVGTSENLFVRSRQNAGSLKSGLHHSHALQALYARDGARAFRIDVLEICDRFDRFDREAVWIETLQPTCNKNHRSKQAHREAFNSGRTLAAAS